MAGIFPAVSLGASEAEKSAASNNDAEAEKFAASKKSFHHFPSRHIYHLIHVPVYQRF
jgi:hypothetical protein